MLKEVFHFKPPLPLGVVLFDFVFAGVGTGERCVINSAKRQSTSASVCGKTGEDSTFHD